MRKMRLNRLFIILLLVTLICGWSGDMLAAPSEYDDSKKNYLQIGLALMNQETLGVLRLGNADNVIVGVLGEPEDKSPGRVWGADGLEHQLWRYASKGIDVGMVKEGDVQKVDRIRIKSPCELRTARGIGIGSTENEVQAAYQKEINIQAGDARRLVAGTIYGGIIFELENGIVSSILIGAAAE